MCRERGYLCLVLEAERSYLRREEREEGIQGRDYDVRVPRCLEEESGDPDGMQVSLQFITRAVQSSRGFRYEVVRLTQDHPLPGGGCAVVSMFRENPRG